MHGSTRTRRHPGQCRRPNREPGQFQTYDHDQPGSTTQWPDQPQSYGGYDRGDLHQSGMASPDLHRGWIDLELSLSLDEDTMNIRTAKSQQGFTLLELMVASAIGLVLILAATSLFKMGMDATFTVTQRAETQQNMRAAVELMTKDISLAGAGLPSGGLQLPTAAVSQFACNQTGTCYVPAHNYPNNSTGGINYMYGIIPGFNNGVQNNAVIPNAPGQINSSITTVHCDYNFPLANFTFTFPTPTSVNVVVVNAAVQPNSILAAGGLNTGDLML